MHIFVMLLQRETLWKMAAEGEKVEKEKVLPKDAQVVAFPIKYNPKL